jgi:hypothetical protein
MVKEVLLLNLKEDLNVITDYRWLITPFSIIVMKFHFFCSWSTQTKVRNYPTVKKTFFVIVLSS